VTKAAFSLEVIDYTVEHPHWWVISAGLFSNFREARDEAKDIWKQESDAIAYRIKPATHEFYESWVANNATPSDVSQFTSGNWV